jgi:diguanylate cyclase (GGDEF)-like protein/PAS domain S-box-containing protein
MDLVRNRPARDKLIFFAILAVSLLLAFHRAAVMANAAWQTESSPATLLAATSFRLICDISTWFCCTYIFWSLGLMAWRMRHRMSFRTAGYGLGIAVVAVSLKRLLDFDMLRAQLATVNPRFTLMNAALSAIIAVSCLLLIPVVQRIVDFGMTATVEHAKFLAAAESTSGPFILMESMRNLLGNVVDFRICFVNEHAMAFLGEPGSALHRRRLSEIALSQEMPGLFSHLVQIVDTGLPYIAEIQHAENQGRERAYSLHAVKMSDGVVLTLTDLSEEKLHQVRLKELHVFSQSIIENAPFSIIATDPNGKIIAANAATEQLTLYRRRELVNRHSLTLLHDAAELSSKSIALSQSHGKPVAAGFPTLVGTLGARKSDGREWTYVRKDGIKTPVHMTLTVLRGERSEITGYLAIGYDISERKKLTDSITYLAHHDTLTRLPNRALLQTRLDEAIERCTSHQKSIAILMIDLDGFKRINDSLGHSIGDELLLSVATRISSTVRRTDTVARVGGDEFVVLLEDLDNADGAVTCAQKLLQAMQQDIHLADHVLRVTASIGICVYPCVDTDAKGLLRNADLAMYDVKRAGGNHLRQYTRALHEVSAKSLRIEQELRTAIERNEFEVFYQPQVNCRTRQIVGVEALIRWNHPTRGLLPPIEFITVAEDTGLIVPLGEWTLRQSCRQIAALSRESQHPLRLAVNLSARQFRQKNLSLIVQQALDDAALASSLLELEITERILMENSGETFQQLARVQELGVGLAIDDFGTGFSSFRYIMDYNVDCLKVDRSFVSKCPQDHHATAIVRAIIAMAHGLNMRVVAEGVETEEQATFLNRRHCDEAQGYLWAKPLSFHALTERLHSESSLLLHPALADEALLIATPQ